MVKPASFTTTAQLLTTITNARISLLLVTGFLFVASATSPVYGQSKADSLFAAAVDADDAGNSETALALYTAVIAEDPTYSSAFWNRALLQTSAVLAASDYRRVTLLDPGNASGWGNLGWSFILMHELEEARAVTLKASQLSPETYSWWLNLGHTYLLTGQAESAKPFYEEAVSRMESSEDLDGALGDFDLFVGNEWEPELAAQAADWMRSAFAR